MDLRRLTAGSAGVALALVVLLPGVASAAPDTPAGTGGGCKLNGLTVAGVAQDPTPLKVDRFGEFVRTQVPIADNNAQFFSEICH